MAVGSSLQSFGTHIKASAAYMAFNVDSAGGGNLGVLPLDSAGRQNRQDLPVIQAHAGKNIVEKFFFNLLYNYSSLF